MSSALPVILVIISFATLLAGGGYTHSTALIAAAAAMAGLFALSFMKSGRRALGDMAPFWGPEVLFLIVMGVAAVQYAVGPTLDREQVLIRALRLLGAGAMFLAAVGVGRNTRALQVLQKGVVVGGLALVVLALALYASHPHSLQDADAGRLRATFPTSPNTAAAVIGVIALMSLGGLLQSLRRLPAVLTVGERIERTLSKAWLEISALGLAVVTFGLTGSRSGVLLIVLSAFTLIVWSRLKDKSGAQGGLGGRALGFIAVVLVIGVGASVTIARLPAIGGDSASRMLIYQAHWPRLFDHPVLGHGLGSFVIVNRAIVNPVNFEALTWVGDMHNVYMQWIEETGFLGAGAMFGCILWCLIVIVRGAGRAESSRTWLKTVAAASLFLLLQGLVEIALQYEGVVLLWCLLLGSAFGVATAKPKDVAPVPALETTAV